MLSVHSRAISAWRTLQSSTSSRPNVKRRIPNGCLFAPLQKAQQITYPHPLDDEAEYRRFLKDDLLDECAYFVRELPRYQDNMIRMLKYTVPGFDTCWTFGPELIYRFAAPKNQQTDENLRKCRILRACVELLITIWILLLIVMFGTLNMTSMPSFIKIGCREVEYKPLLLGYTYVWTYIHKKFASTTLTDDIADGSDMRKGKPSWKMVSPGGISTAIFDGMLLDTLPYFLVKKYFRDSPGYVRMIETLSKASLDLIIGESLDTLSHNNVDELTGNAYKDILRMKAGRIVAMESVLGTLHAGILDEEILQKVDNIFCGTGELIQIWDDFCDYYCTSSQTGKPSCDLINAGATWASTICMKYFSETEKKEFKECYGSGELEKMETVRRLYDSINLPNIYIDYMKQRYLICKEMIDDLHHEGLEEACHSWLKWLLGNVMEN